MFLGLEPNAIIVMLCVYAFFVIVCFTALCLLYFVPGTFSNGILNYPYIGKVVYFIISIPASLLAAIIPMFMLFTLPVVVYHLNGWGFQGFGIWIFISLVAWILLFVNWMSDSR